MRVGARAFRDGGHRGRELAIAWSLRLDEIARAMTESIAAQVPGLADDEELAGLTLASCASNVEAILSMMRHGIPASATEAPVAALEHARRMAVRGVTIDATLRFYRLGHAFFWDLWSSALVGVIADRDRLELALRETSAFVFAYIDVVSTRVETEQLAERDRRQQRAAIARVEVVRAIMASEAVDPGAAERALGRRLDGRHLAYVCWTDGDSGSLEGVAVAVAEALGTAHPLVLPAGPDALAAWATVGDGVLPPLEAVVSAASPDARVALGEPASGLAGFRSSREQAERARRVARLTDASVVTAYADVALVDLLSGDLVAARAFLTAELGELAQADEAGERLREAVLAVVAPHGGLAAAARTLDVHRNTVLQRVHRAEELLGRPLTERAAELHAALLLAQVLGPA